MENKESKSLREIWDDNLGALCKSISSGTVQGNKVIDNVWCFSSFSGGNGVSTTVGNVAKILANKSLRVLIIDLNLNYPIHWVHTELEYGLNSKDLYDLVLGMAELKSTILNGTKISLLGCGSRSLGELNNLETRVVGNNFEMVLNNLRTLYDVILIDCPFGSHTSMLSNTALYYCDKCYMVWSDAYSNINNYIRVIDNFKLFGINTGKLRYIYNKRGSSYINTGIFDELGIKGFIEVLPYDKSIVECSLEGKYFTDSGSGTSENASIYYNKLFSLVDIMLMETGYNLDKSNLSDLLGYLGKDSDTDKGNSKSKGRGILGKLRKKGKVNKGTGIDNKLIDEITGVESELDGNDAYLGDIDIDDGIAIDDDGIDIEDKE